ncbi:MAG: S8 family serine peptidase [bacterium]|nr:MAG: S8 family serine peptidase [bacterium]
MQAKHLVIVSFIAVLFAVLLISNSLFAGNDKFNPSLTFLKHLKEKPELVSKIKGPMLSATRNETASVTIKFDHELTEGEIEQYRQLGVSFYYIDGNIAKTRSIYPARIPWSVLDEMAARTDVLRIEGNWNPAVYPLLDVSAHEIEADSAWTHTDPLGQPITGKGMRIADFDTGIDVFHPSFFYADGDTFDWIDVDGFMQFNPGYDAVDLNNNGTAESNEILDFYDGWIYDPAMVWGSGNPSNNDGYFQADWDWLYNDANTNGIRDFGTGAGYTESDPTYGELLFIALDTNGNNGLDLGEKVVALNTSKIYATMNADSIERVRGVDLIQSDPDDYGHGTPVSGILAGGTPGWHKFTGIAPDAEILMGYFFSDVAISYLIPWARNRGADVMLYEFGSFIWRYLDGSSLDEQLISIENQTILQITPSGNLGRGDKHAIATVPQVDSVTMRINVPTYGGQSILQFYGTTLWRTIESDLTFRFETPVGGEVTLESGDYFFDGYYIYCEKSTSSRGTCAWDYYIDRYSNTNVMGTWTLKVVNNNLATDIKVISNVADHLSSWAGGAEFLDYATDQENVTHPATSDSAFANGSYSTRGFEGYGGVGGGSIPAGEISAFSGRGVRIDGKHLLDIASPGNYDVYSTRTHQDGAGYPNGGYRQFSGTSAAGPHVAAAAALVQQAFPFATMDEVAWLLSSHAEEDGFTGPVYNDTWGYGKLRILGAIGVATAVEDMARGKRPPRLLLDRNYPNPFNPTTWIPFYLPKDGVVSLRIYNVKGELVRVLRLRWMNEGAHSVRWGGLDSNGRQVTSGVYFCELRFGNETQTRKLVLLR